MKERFFACPGWPQLRFAWLLSALNTAWFWFVYGGCSWITAHRTLRVRVNFPFELSIPLVPGTVLIYMSIYLLFFAGPFIIRDRREFTTLIFALTLATFCGGIGFLLVPSQPAYAPPTELGIWTAPFHFAQWLSLSYNMVPSLHVALSVCCISAYSRHASPLGRRLLWTWAAAIALSTLLTHQHHVIDVITGWAVGVGASRFVRRRLNVQRGLTLVPEL